MTNIPSNDDSDEEKRDEPAMNSDDEFALDRIGLSTSNFDATVVDICTKDGSIDIAFDFDMDQCTYSIDSICRPLDCKSKMADIKFELSSSN